MFKSTYDEALSRSPLKHYQNSPRYQGHSPVSSIDETPSAPAPTTTSASVSGPSTTTNTTTTTTTRTSVSPAPPRTPPAQIAPTFSTDPVTKDYANMPSPTSEQSKTGSGAPATGGAAANSSTDISKSNYTATAYGPASKHVAPEQSPIDFGDVDHNAITNLPDRTATGSSSQVGGAGSAATPASAQASHEQTGGKAPALTSPAGNRIRICVFCSTQPGALPSGVSSARRLAQALHQNGVELIYGGGTVGLMGALAEERVRLGRPDDVLGVIPYALLGFERDPNAEGTGNIGTGLEGLKEYLKDATTPKSTPSPSLMGGLGGAATGKATSQETDSSGDKKKKFGGFLRRHKEKRAEAVKEAKIEEEIAENQEAGVGGYSIEKSPYGKDTVLLPVDETFGRVVAIPNLTHRKALMMDLVKNGAPGSGFIALPGGFGSLDEVLEVITHRQMGKHQDSIVLVNVDGYWDGIKLWMDNALRRGFINEDSRSFVHVVDAVEDAVDILVGASDVTGTVAGPSAAAAGPSTTAAPAPAASSSSSTPAVATTSNTAASGTHSSYHRLSTSATPAA